MPQFRAEIPEIHTRITRPVAKAIVDDVLKRFKDIPFREFRFSGDSEQLLMPGSAVDTDIKNRATVDNYVDVEVEDLVDDEFGRSFQATNQVNHFLFRCEKTKLDLFPVYQNRKLVISFKVVSSSRVRLNGLVNRMQEGMQQSQTLFTHIVSYNYDIPVACTVLIDMFYHMMQSNHPYDITYDQWIKDCSIPNLETAVRLDGKVPTMVYRENAVNVLSNLVEHEEAPRKAKDDDNGVWNIAFDLEVRYQRPNSIRASYPPIVHNQFLHEDWFNRPKTFDYRSQAATASIAGKAIERFKWNLGYGVPGQGDTGVKEPWFDDWGIKNTNERLIRLITALVTIDEADLVYFFDPVNDLSEYQFPEEIIRLMKLLPMALFHDGKHFIDVKAYRWNDRIRPEHLSMDEDGRIVTDFDLNPRNYYHIIFSLNMDPTTIATELWELALCEPEGLITYFSIFGDQYGKKIRDVLIEMGAQEGEEVCISREVVNDIIKDLIDDGWDFDNGKLYWDLYSWRNQVTYSVIGEKGI